MVYGFLVDLYTPGKGEVCQLDWSHFTGICEVGCVVSNAGMLGIILYAMTCPLFCLKGNAVVF